MVFIFKLCPGHVVKPCGATLPTDIYTSMQYAKSLKEKSALYNPIVLLTLAEFGNVYGFYCYVHEIPVRT